VRPETAALIKSLVPVVQAHGQAIASRMYYLLFEENPELLNYFSLEFEKDFDERVGGDNDDGRTGGCPILAGGVPSESATGDRCPCRMEGVNESSEGVDSKTQAGRLAFTLLAYCANVDEVEKIGAEIQRICQTHVMRGIHSSHYGMVGVALLEAIQDVLKDAVTEEILGAFGEVYGIISDILVEEESRMRKELGSRDGGWDGFRGFRVVEKTSVGKTSCYILESVDLKPVTKPLPGQCLCVRWKMGPIGSVMKAFPLEMLPPAICQGPRYAISVTSPSTPGYWTSAAEAFLQYVAEGTLVEATPPSGGFMFKDNSSLQKRLATHSVRSRSDVSQCPMRASVMLKSHNGGREEGPANPQGLLKSKVVHPRGSSEAPSDDPLLLSLGLGPSKIRSNQREDHDLAEALLKPKTVLPRRNGVAESMNSRSKPMDTRDVPSKAGDTSVDSSLKTSKLRPSVPIPGTPVTPPEIDMDSTSNPTDPNSHVQDSDSDIEHEDRPENESAISVAAQLLNWKRVGARGVGDMSPRVSQRISSLTAAPPLMELSSSPCSSPKTSPKKLNHRVLSPLSNRDPLKDLLH